MGIDVQGVANLSKCEGARMLKGGGLGGMSKVMKARAVGIGGGKGKPGWGHQDTRSYLRPVVRSYVYGDYSALASAVFEPAQCQAVEAVKEVLPGTAYQGRLVGLNSPDHHLHAASSIKTGVRVSGLLVVFRNEA